MTDPRRGETLNGKVESIPHSRDRFRAPFAQRSRARARVSRPHCDDRAARTPPAGLREGRQAVRRSIWARRAFRRARPATRARSYRLTSRRPFPGRRCASSHQSRAGRPGPTEARTVRAVLPGTRGGGGPEPPRGAHQAVLGAGQVRPGADPGAWRGGSRPCRSRGPAAARPPGTHGVARAGLPMRAVWHGPASPMRTVRDGYRCAVGRTTSSLTSTSRGCVTAKAMASAIAVAGMASCSAAARAADRASGAPP